MRPGWRRVDEQHRVRRYRLRHLAVRNQRDRRRRERRMDQKFADGTGMRSVKHRTRMKSLAAGRNSPAMMTPAVVMAAVAMALSSIMILRAGRRPATVSMVVQPGRECAGEQIARRHQPCQHYPKRGHTAVSRPAGRNRPPFLTRRWFRVLDQTPQFPAPPTPFLQNDCNYSFGWRQLASPEWGDKP